ATVWGTSISARKAVHLEREKRQDDFSHKRYAEAQILLADFLGVWNEFVHSEALGMSSAGGEIRPVTTLSARVALLMPELEDIMDEMSDIESMAPADISRLQDEFMKRAHLSLRALNPVREKGALQDFQQPIT